MRTPLVGTRVKPVPAKTEGDRAAANRVASVRLGGDGDISRLTQCTILTAAADKPEGPCEGHAETAPAGPTRPTADEGAPVNAYADRTLASINERLISLAGYEMHEVTNADSATSDETTLIGTLQLQSAIDTRVWRAAADRPTDRRSRAAAAANNQTMPDSRSCDIANTFFNFG
jgi:hypothetical protein